VVFNGKKSVQDVSLFSRFSKYCPQFLETIISVAANEVQCHTKRKRELTTSFAFSWTLT